MGYAQRYSLRASSSFTRNYTRSSSRESNFSRSSRFTLIETHLKSFCTDTKIRDAFERFTKQGIQDWQEHFIGDIQKQKQHLDDSFSYLQQRAQIKFPTILGGEALRYEAVKETIAHHIHTAGAAENFGTIHQPGQGDDRKEKFQMETASSLRGEAKGLGGVLETKHWSMSFNILSTLTPSVFNREHLIYARESGTTSAKQQAGKIEPWEHSINSKGQIPLTQLIHHKDGTPNSKAKELKFLLKTGFEAIFTKVGHSDHIQLSFIPPHPKVFQGRVPKALEDLGDFIRQDIRSENSSAHKEFKKLLDECGILEGSDKRVIH